MANTPEVPKYEVQIGEHGAETCVGVKPPLSASHIQSLYAKLPARQRPAEVIPDKPRDDTSYTILKFLHPHFGKYRNIYAMNAVDAITDILRSEKAIVEPDETIRDLHGDNRLFD